MRKFLLLVVALFLFSPTATFAIDPFHTSYDVTYTIAESGMTHAQMNIVLTNNTTKYYATEYKVNLGFTNVQNIRVKDPSGTIVATIIKAENGNTIEIPFNKKSVGKDTALPFTLSFDTPDATSKQGSLWEVSIPGISNQTDITKFNVRVVVPPSFGKPLYVKPETPGNTLSFTKDMLGKAGISIAFGKPQTYSFDLTYHLKNTKLFPIKTEIALPPSTNYQDVAILDIFPQPNNIIQDRDGNWMAQYSLAPSQGKVVKVKGVVQVSPTAKGKEPLTDPALYTKPRTYWEQTDQIKKLARELKTPHAIYQYVVKTLSYDPKRVVEGKPRLGAQAVLQAPSSAVCLEFTDLFIALARAAGIPAREVDGFAFSQNDTYHPRSLVKDILHAWPEYYDTTTQTWIMVDPTWGNTTNGVDYFHLLDYDHVAFVIKGVSSDYPIPAGGYKLPGMEHQKDVSISFAQAFPQGDQELAITGDIPTTAVAGFPIKGSVTLTNRSSRMLAPQPVKVSASSDPSSEHNVTFDAIPPYGSVSLPVEFGRTSFLTNQKSVVTIRVANQTVTQNVLIQPVYQNKQALILGGIIFVLFTVIIFGIARGARHLPLFKR